MAEPISPQISREFWDYEQNIFSWGTIIARKYLPLYKQSADSLRKKGLDYVFYQPDEQIEPNGQQLPADRVRIIFVPPKKAPNEGLSPFYRVEQAAAAERERLSQTNAKPDEIEVSVAAVIEKKSQEEATRLSSAQPAPQQPK